MKFCYYFDCMFIILLILEDNCLHFVHKELITGYFTYIPLNAIVLNISNIQPVEAYEETCLI